LLPRELTELYEELYAQSGYLHDFIAAWFTAGGNVANFESQFTTHTASGQLDLSFLTDAELREYSAFLTRYITQSDALTSVLEFYAKEVPHHADRRRIHPRASPQNG